MKAALQCRNFVSWLPSILFVSWVVYEQGLLSPYLKLLKGFRSLLNFTYKGSLLLWYFHIYNASWAWWQLLEMKHPVLSSVVPFVGLCFHFFLSLLPHHSREPEVSWLLPLLISGSPFESVLSLTDIFQKLAAVKEQREWVTTSGAHKVSGPQRASSWVHMACGIILHTQVPSPMAKLHIIIGHNLFTQPKMMILYEHRNK